jgi:hypothetical protein
MCFGKWSDAVAFQGDSLNVGDCRLNNRDVRPDKTGMLNSAFWTKLFPAYHVKPISPETLLRFLPDQAMPIAESVHDFDLSRLQCRQSFGIGLSVRGTPGTDQILRAFFYGNSGESCVRRSLRLLRE